MPIRDELTTFSPQVNTPEYGHGFTLLTARTLQEARVYVSEIPANLQSASVMAAIYPRGLEQASGPIRRVVIPVDAVTVTGATLNASGLATGPAVLLSPAFGGYYSFDSDHVNDMVFLNFNAQEYTVLTGKRILAVNLLYAAQRTTPDPISPVAVAAPQIGLLDSTNQTGDVVFSDGEELPTTDSALGLTTIAQLPAARLRFGISNPFAYSRLGWTFPTDIGRFDSSSVSKLYATFKMGTAFGSPANLTLYLWYAALEVIFCEEQRVALGFGLNDAAQMFSGEPTYGAGVITLRSVPAGAVFPTLQPGDYSLLISGVDSGNRLASGTTGLQLNAERELYQIPTHPGMQLNVPFPPENYVDSEFELVETRVLPQISLHASGGTLTEPHVYGRQGKAPVYGAITATQDIFDDITATITFPYPQVRFYARKFDTTTVPLKLDSTNVTGSGIAVQITPAEHDQLPEIIDGWKECTLRFPTAPNMGAVTGFPAWRFSSVGEKAGSQWQVLSACAPAVSGVPGSLLTQATPVHRLGTGTYQPNSGDTVELTWMSPYATGAVVDPDCDAVLIFSQDPATVTGVSISQATQTVTGVGLDCGGATPCCMVTGIGYNRITWGLPVNTGIADDDFARTVAAGGWGTASDGKAWTTSGTAGDFSVDGDEGLIDLSATGSNRLAWVDVGGPWQDVTVAVRIDELAESGTLKAGVVARLTDANNYWRATISYDSAGATQLTLTQVSGGVETDIQTVNLFSLGDALTTPRMIRLQVDGIYIRCKAWDSDQIEPWWQIVTSSSGVTTGNNAGVYARDDTGAATSNWYFTQFTVRPPAYSFDTFELQRFDSQVGTFETIMLASSIAVTGFNDYEARVGIDSVYRIRRRNVYQFAGQWSVQVTGAPTAPGVSGNGTCDMTGALIFTSNADQSGQRNCAYMPNWDFGTPVETFNLPEGGAVAYQELYDRDGRVAFHGTERGLEAFTRQILVQAASVSPTVLANVRTLRDLAWDDLPYVCVRDEEGNRWFANVRVNNASAMNDREAILADVSVVETTRTPATVDP